MIILLISLTLGVGVLQAQTLTGTIKNFNQPIDSAEVYTIGEQRLTVTDKSGEFSLSYNQLQDSTLIVQAKGYKSDTIKLNERSKITITLTEIGADYQIRVYEVFGMGCPRCHSGLENQLNKQEGVIDAKANWYTKTVAVKVKPGATPSLQTIREAVEKANLTPGKRLQ